MYSWGKLIPLCFFFNVEKPWITLKTSSSFHKTFCEARSQIVSAVPWLWFREFLGSPAKVGENWDVRRGTGCWRWQIAEASGASSITPCGYTMWLPLPQETWSTFHLYKTGVFGGIDKDFRSILCCYSNSKEGLDMLCVFSAFEEN